MYTVILLTCYLGWTCHVGGKTTGFETVQKIELRVVDKIAALAKNVTAEHGAAVTISCATTQGFLPLSYCRFEPPKANPFSINAAVTRMNSIKHRYYFPNNKSLDRGDCAVTIHQAKYDDMGIWTCGAGMSDGKEYTDTIMVKVEGLYTMSTATSVGLMFGVLTVFCILIALGYVAWYRRTVLGIPREGAHAADNEGQEMGDIELDPVPTPPGSATPIRRSPTSSRTPSGQVTPIRRSPAGSRTPSGQVTPIRRSSTSFRSPPVLVVQSPSEPGSSPLISPSAR